VLREVIQTVKIRSQEESSKRYVMGSIDCFLRGEKSLNWIVGMIRSSGIEGTAILKNLFSIYGSTTFQAPEKNTRFQELEKACKQLGYI
jgi:hypothetical protein